MQTRLSERGSVCPLVCLPVRFGFRSLVDHFIWFSISHCSCEGQINQPIDHVDNAIEKRYFGVMALVITRVKFEKKRKKVCFFHYWTEGPQRMFH